MKRTNAQVDRAVEKIWRDQAYLVTRGQVLSGGLTVDALRHRLRTGGPWTAVLPGIYHTRTGPLSGAQREIAAVLYAGPGCMITGPAALEQQGVRVPMCDFVDVLIPQERQRQSVGFVRAHRTGRMPERPWGHGGILWAPPARAISDAVRGEFELANVRALVADAVQHRKCTIGQLTEELRLGPRRGSGLLRTVLEEVAEGVASAAEGDLRRLIRSGRLPEPVYNPDLYVGSEFLARPDVWWRDAGVAAELDSREWHLSPDQWTRTMARHARMSAQGIIVLHFTPGRIRSDGAQVVAELRSAIEAGLRRPRLDIRTLSGR